MAGRDIIVLGFSAGGVEAMGRVVADLPETLPAAILVVHHFPPSSVSALPRILERAGRLPARHAVHEEPILPGRIYVAPPDLHLLLNRKVVLARGPKENGHRPAIDPLFRTAAKAYGPRVIGVLLSGTLDDGTAGIMMVKKCGGLAVVQAPADAMYSGMPSSALAHALVDYAVPVAEMGQLLVRLVGEPAGARPEADTAMASQESRSPDSALGGARDLEYEEVDGPPSGLTCPECGGALWELKDGELVRYRCHVGHAFTADNMMTQQAESLEAALWTAIRALEEKAELSRRLLERAKGRGWRRTAEQFEAATRMAENGSELIRQLVTRGGNEMVPQGESEA
jgi:two-component system, chemotaxis family, protein-glutamate methylesterase/glutaminase